MIKLSKAFIVTVAAIVCISVMMGLGISAVTKINKLNEQIDSLSSRINQIDYNNSSTQQQINNLKTEIRNLLEEQSRNYSDVNHKITEINAQNNTATVEVYFSLKESPLSGDVEISYGKGNHLSQIVATKLASGKYMAQLELQIDKDYEISYSVSLSSVRTEKLTEINVFNQLKNRFSASSSYYSVNRGSWKIDFYLSNSYSNLYVINGGYIDDNLKIATASLEILKNNTLIKTIDIKNYTVTEGNEYEQFSCKDIVITEVTEDDFKNGNVETRITVVDNYGLTYVFGK